MFTALPSMEKHQELLIALRKVIRAIDLHSKHLSKTSGLTSPQLLIMNCWNHRNVRSIL